MRPAAPRGFRFTLTRSKRFKYKLLFSCLEQGCVLRGVHGEGEEDGEDVCHEVCEEETEERSQPGERDRRAEKVGFLSCTDVFQRD